MTEEPQGGGRRPRKRALKGRVRNLQARLGGVPVDRLLTTVRGPLMLEVEEARGAKVETVRYRVDRGAWEPMIRFGHVWRVEIDAGDLSDGPHEVEMEVKDVRGTVEQTRGTFTVRRRAI